MIRKVMHYLARVICFFLVSVPSLVYGISPYLFIPIGWLIRLFIGRPVFSYKAGIIALKLSTLFLLLIVPTVLYLYVWELLGWIFFIWMGLYLLIRIYSGVHGKQQVVIEAWKHLDTLEEKYKHIYVKYNPIVTIITIILSLASIGVGYYFGGEKGLWIVISISAVVWCLSPFVREIIIE